ncbi:MAG: 50S ribosomal protein L29 [Planctomycetota bacterium]
MKRNELLEARDLPAEDLEQRIADTQKKIFNLRFQMAIEGAQKNAEYSRSRRTLAQLKTILRQKETAGKAGVEEKA